MDTTPITSGCGLCGAAQCPIRCDSCQVITYCSQEHKAAHNPTHLGICLDIKSQRTNVTWTESRLPFNTKFVLHPCQKLRRFPPGRLGRRLASNGLSWQDDNEKAYVQSRLDLGQALSGVRTRESLQAQLTHVMDVLKMSDSAPRFLRILAPVLMLRLDQDQNCYSFLKWWARAKEARSKKVTTHYNDPGLWFQAINLADFFEPVDFVHDLAHTIIMTLFKIKILLGIRNLDTLASISVEEDSETFLRGAARTAIVSDRCKLMMDGSKRQEMIDVLLMQVEKLYDGVAKKNGCYWSALVSAEGSLEWKPDMKKHGFLEDMQDILGYTHDAWRETPGAIDFIRDKVQKEVQQKVQVNAGGQAQAHVQDRGQDQVEGQVDDQVEDQTQEAREQIEGHIKG
ncbi:hypothetical protein BO94DRAFT_595946 [Aspergillus sclerotioniger CBS 115572]|uniref:MYND-type domain-containing protein n=1 Tax=Aspergillus sclerotioniger CBS 115572 TaxID=1450535 RepID=A0A317WNQ2_9EURO|nr:hypothetical protein BO94DRAFT_595946 [Aspergillus sclerotioniger CBS 115572]PWY88099.1 hypothetical protein BO94DRAFT_595946 [Aspergillus sclerotioniger CBS 115572]